LNAKESLNVEMRNEKMVGAKEQYSLGCHDFEFFLAFPRFRTTSQAMHSWGRRCSESHCVEGCDQL
jgi:hypothetical protein